MLAVVVPQIGVDAARGFAALRHEVFATDEVMRRVRDGTPFRTAYRAVAHAVHRGDAMPILEETELAAARSSTGAIGNVPIAALRQRVRGAQRWARGERRRFTSALTRLTATRSR
jgi:argininosuccinate lyase